MLNRPINIKYLVYFTLEEIVSNQKQMETDIDLREHFKIKLYENERKVFANLKNDFTSDIESYIE